MAESSPPEPPKRASCSSGAEETAERRIILKRQGEDIVQLTKQAGTKRFKMAGNLAQKASFEEMVTCPICMEWMESPKHLQCQHAFCLNCLKDWVSQPDTPKNKICCPVCRHDTPITSRVSALPNDINVTRILDVLHGMEATSKKQNCGSDTNEAAYYCQDCRTNFCSECFQTHDANRRFSRHTIEVLKRKCKTHPAMPANFFCRQCRNFACMVCKEHGHLGHNIKTVKSVANGNKNTIDHQIKMLRRKLSEKDMYSSQVRGDAVVKMFDDVTEAIVKHSEKGISLIERWRENLLQEVTKKKALALEQASEYESQYAICESLVTYTESLLDGPDYEIVSEYLHLQRSLKEAYSDLESQLQKSHMDTVKEAHFYPNPWPSTFGSVGRPGEASTPSSPLSPSGSFELLSPSCSSTPSAPQRPCAPPPEAAGHSGFKSATLSKRNLESPTFEDSSSSLYPRLDSGIGSPIASEASSPEFNGSIPGIDEVGEEVGISATAPPIEDSHVHRMDKRLSEYSFDILGRNWTQTNISFSKNINPEESFVEGLVHAAKGFFAWVSGKKKDGLQSSIDISVDSNQGLLYLLKMETREVYRYDFPTDLQLDMPQLVMNHINAPCSIAVGPSDDTFAATAGPKVHFHPRGYIPDFSDKGGIVPREEFHPFTMCTSHALSISENNHWVVLDRTKCIVGIYQQEETLNSGSVFRHLLTFGSAGSKQGRFVQPTDVCVDSPRNRVYVSDTGNHRIQAFSLDGRFIWQSGKRGSQRGEFNTPRGLCVDCRGNVIVTDSGNSRLAVLRGQDGKCQMLVDTNTKALNNICPYSVGIYNPEYNNTAYIIMAGLRNGGRMPMVSIIKYIKGH